ncbi:MAG: DNA methyltransferase, partial [Myxococcota bacterium]
DDGRMREALVNVGGPIETEGDPALAAILARAWEAASDPEDDATGDTLTHGFHAYPARMPPALARSLLAELAPRRVLDPFCGSGTVLVEARLAGAAATGVDLNPLALQLAGVKTRETTRADREGFQRALRSIAAASEERVRGRVEARAPLRGDDLRRYGPHVLKELAGLLEEIRSVRERRTREALEMVFSAIVIKVSQQRADTAERMAPKRIRKGLSTEFFARKGEELVARWEALAEALPPRSAGPTLKRGDVRRLDEVLPAGWRYELVLTSPPYGGTYDYVDHHRLRAQWLGVRLADLEAREIGARRHLRAPGDRRRWDAELGAAMGAAGMRLAQHGLLVMVLGDGQIGGRRVPAEAQVAALAGHVGLRPVARASQPRVDWTGGPPRREHLLALQRAQGR